jgi:hypothetical protein
MVAGIIFGVLIIAVLVVWGLLRIRDRRSYKDEE